jgi:hypothetical protein
MRKILIILLALCVVSLSHPGLVRAAPALEVSANTAVINFPETVTFRAHLQSQKKITSVVLEYGNEQLTCGEVIAKAFPQFTPAPQMDVEWTWEMRQSGALPPGAIIWWRWHFTDESGFETISERQTIIWLDSLHKWKTVSAPNLNVHWYQGGESFAREILVAAQAGLGWNETFAALKPEGAIDLYIYANTNDLKDAILYEPNWVGGQAFSEFNIVIIGIDISELDWGKKAVVHELTHVLVGHLTFSCLSDIPTWLNEGLAVNSEGNLDSNSQIQFDDAVRTNELLSVRSLSGGFSEVPDKAYLSYSESYSITKFLIDTYGQQKMTDLLLGIRDGATIDQALQKSYGFNVEGLEDAWRVGIGAQARDVVPNATATPAPTYVPTIVPVSGVQLAVTPTPFSVPTSSGSSSPSPTESGSSLPASNETTLVILGIVTACCCCLLLIVLVIVVIVFVVKRKGGTNA